MTREHWTDRLSEYLDGDLAPAERAAAERHLAECAECSAVLAELRAVVMLAAREPAAAPGRDLWPEIRSRLAPRHGAVVPLSSRRLMLTIPQSLAAAVALVALAAGAVWVSGVGVQESSQPVLAAGEPVGVPMFVGYESAMSDLEAEYDRRRDDLDPETIRVVERNLALIDAAIAEARQALASDPSSGFLNAHLAESMRRRLSLLRQVASI